MPACLLLLEIQGLVAQPVGFLEEGLFGPVLLSEVGLEPQQEVLVGPEPPCSRA